VLGFIEALENSNGQILDRAYTYRQQEHDQETEEANEIAHYYKLNQLTTNSKYMPKKRKVR
jgi:hypothetical protein